MSEAEGKLAAIEVHFRAAEKALGDYVGETTAIVELASAAGLPLDFTPTVAPSLSKGAAVAEAVSQLIVNRRRFNEAVRISAGSQ